MRVLDEDDTYLVVAADKGTATFSDTANAVSEERGFWLGDAFASGGSTGYDHKALGITARGAWESVKRHFSELDLDLATRAVHRGRDRRHVRRRVRQRHAAVGPDPARRRLRPPPRVHRPRPGPGGRVRRAQAAVRAAGLLVGRLRPREDLRGRRGLAAHARSRSRSRRRRAPRSAIEDERLAPNDVIRAILRAPVDLLWNGGIGTVVKASDETDADAKDRASDAIRVDARDLRCRVVGEGGNLGLTRRARVEFAARRRPRQRRLHRQLGRRRLLRPRGQPEDPARARRAARRARPARRATSCCATSPTTSSRTCSTTRSCRRRSSSQEVAVARGADVRLRGPDGGAGGRRAARPRRRGAADGAEEIAERRRAGRGLERPELALLLAYAKRAIARDLLASDFCEDPWLERDLREYFPGPRRRALRPPARRAPAAARADRDGQREPRSSTRSARRSSPSSRPSAAPRPADVVRAFRIAREVTGADARWDAVESLPRRLDRARSRRADGGRRPARRGRRRAGTSPTPAEAALEERIAAAEAPFARLVARAARDRRGRLARAAPRRSPTTSSAQGVPRGRRVGARAACPS